MLMATFPKFPPPVFGEPIMSLRLSKLIDCQHVLKRNQKGAQGYCSGTVVLTHGPKILVLTNLMP